MTAPFWGDKPTDKTPNPWPIGGYAPGGYICRCASCDRKFIGDKRARECLECAVHSLKTGHADAQYAAGFKAGIEAAAKVSDYYADADYAAMGYPESGGMAASGTADMIRRDIRAIPVPDAPDLTLPPDEVRKVRDALDVASRVMEDLGACNDPDCKEPCCLHGPMVVEAALAILDGKGASDAD